MDLLVGLIVGAPIAVLFVVLLHNWVKTTDDETESR